MPEEVTLCKEEFPIYACLVKNCKADQYVLCTFISIKQKMLDYQSQFRNIEDVVHTLAIHC